MLREPFSFESVTDRSELLAKKVTETISCAKVSKVIQDSWLWESEEHIAGALKESAMGPKFNREKFIEAFSRLADFSTDGAIGAANKIAEFVEWTEPDPVAA